MALVQTGTQAAGPGPMANHMEEAMTTRVLNLEEMTEVSWGRLVAASGFSAI